MHYVVQLLYKDTYNTINIMLAMDSWQMFRTPTGSINEWRWVDESNTVAEIGCTNGQRPNRHRVD